MILVNQDEYLLIASSEYLVVEALLDIFANLLPPIAVKDRRQDFVNSTFDATFFPGSSQLRNILLSPTGGVTDWEVLSQDILNTLAAAHIALYVLIIHCGQSPDCLVPNRSKYAQRRLMTSSPTSSTAYTLTLKASLQALITCVEYMLRS